MVLLEKLVNKMHELLLLSILILQRESTLQNTAEDLLSFRDTKVCTGTGEALGCIDSECTFAFKLEYSNTETVVTDRTEITTITCSN